MGKRLFVGQLPYETTQDELTQIFSSIGPVVSATVIVDKFTGRSKGFGFVEMSSPEDAQKAIETLNNTQVAGRAIAVSEARPQEDRPRGGGFGGGGGRGGFGGGGRPGGFGGGGGRPGGGFGGRRGGGGRGFDRGGHRGGHGRRDAGGGGGSWE